MSQSGFTPIQLYRSATPGAVPLAGNLAPGELAVNTADQKLFFENASGTVVSSVPFNTTGVLDVANGGTGASTLTANYILKGNGTSAVSSSVLYENGGYLGIGTTGPAVLFDAQQTLNGSGGISYTNLSTGASSAASITAEAGGSYLTLNVTRATGVVQFRGVTATTLNQDFNTQIFRSTGATEYMRVTSAGNLGLGTSAPVGRLMVAAADTSNTIGSATASINITNTDAGAFGRTANLNFTLDDGNLSTRRLATISGVYAGFGGGGTEGALAFATQFNGSLSERMRISSAGNVGIGTNAPGYKLDVSATGNISGQFKTSGSINALFLADAGTTAESLYIGTVGNDFRVVTGSNERMRVTSVGDVGIGTASPGTKLEVSSTSAGATAEVLRLNNPGGGANTAAQIKFFAAGTNYASITGGYGAAAAQMTFNMPTASAGNYVWQGNSIEQMRLDASGNLGIGTSSTSGKLTIAVAPSGTFQFAVATSNATDSDLFVRIKTGISDIYNSAGSTTFSTGALPGTERMRIDGSTGNVGIGTSAPATVVDASFSGGMVRAGGVAGNNLIQAYTGSVGLGMWAGGIPRFYSTGSMIFSVNSTIGTSAPTGYADAMTITSAGNVGIGTTAPTTGSMSNVAILSAGLFSTNCGSVASTSGVAVTLGAATLGGNETYIVSVGIYSGAPTVYSAVSIVSADAGVLRTTALQTATLMTISVSGTNIQATQASGGSANIVFSITRVA